MRKVEGNGLIFISKIGNDGKFNIEMTEEDNQILKHGIFELYPLSIRLGTYIALGFNSFIVKIKK